MADIVSKEVRSKMMAGIREKNTKPELFIRKGLHHAGFRYSLHRKDLPGKPDLVLPKYNAVIFVHGCFWHKHGCHLFTMPTTRREFWRNKLQKNVQKDTKCSRKLTEDGWRIGIIWECALKGKTRKKPDEIIRTCAKWLLSKKRYLEIKGIQ